MSAPGLAYVQGRLVDLARAQVPLLDRGFLYGDGVFETMRAANGVVFRLEDHARRLARGTRALGLDESAEAGFRDAVAALVGAGTGAFGPDLYVRVTVTTGRLEEALEVAGEASVTGICRPYRPYPAHRRSEGVRLILSRERRDSRSAALGIKSISFLPHVSARREARAAGADDALLLNEHGRVAEATTANVFAVRGGVVHAPGESEGAVAGVTRTAVLELLRERGPAVVESLDVETLEGADEAWLTNTLGGVVPVRAFAGRPLGGGRDGLATSLASALEALIRA